MFLGQSLVWQQVWKHLEQISSGNASVSAPSVFGTSHLSPTNSGGTNVSLQNSISALERSLASIGDDSTTGAPLDATSVFDPQRPLKRARVDEANTASSGRLTSAQSLPDDLVDSLVEVYFERIHPWIPMLHVHRFRQDLQNPTRRPKLSTILHAITSITLRFSNDPRVADFETRKAASKRSREIVILQSMEIFSVTNLQALIICAFDTVRFG